MCSKLSEIWFGLFIPDPDPDFLPIRLLGVKRAPDPGSGSATLAFPISNFFSLQLRARRSGGSRSRRIRAELEGAGGPRRTNAPIWLYSACPGRPRSRSFGSILSLLERSSWPRFVLTPYWYFIRHFQKMKIAIRTGDVRNLPVLLFASFQENLLVQLHVRQKFKKMFLRLEQILGFWKNLNYFCKKDISHPLVFVLLLLLKPKHLSSSCRCLLFGTVPVSLCKCRLQFTYLPYFFKCLFCCGAHGRIESKTINILYRCRILVVWLRKSLGIFRV